MRQERHQRLVEIFEEVQLDQNLSERGLAIAIGCTATDIQRWKTGKGRPDVEHLEALAKLMRLSGVDELLAILDNRQYKTLGNYQGGVLPAESILVSLRNLSLDEAALVAAKASTLVLSRVGAREEVESPYAVNDSTMINLTYTQRLRLQQALWASMDALGVNANSLARQAKIEVSTLDEILNPSEDVGFECPEYLLEAVRPYILQFKRKAGGVEIIKNQAYPSITELIKALNSNSENGVRSR